MIYRRFKHRIICWTHAALFEIAIAQIAVGVSLWVWALFRGGEPPIVLAMSALALVFSGWTTAAVVAVGERMDEESSV